MANAYTYGETRITDDELKAATSIMVNKLGPPQSARTILKDVESGKRSCEDVAKEFANRCDVANSMTNAVVRCQAITGKNDDPNPMAADSIKAAQKLDQKKGGSDYLPLRGLPISVKECFLLKGTDSTLGLGQFKSVVDGPDHIVNKTGAFLETLIRLGAVPICKTNVPQLMYSWECNNPVYGYTNTPSCVDFIPGGSSGGESSLIAAGGSVVGIGTDIGGSCRTPAHFGGCCGIKPTFARLGSRGRSPALPHGAQNEILAAAGILGRSTDDIVTLMEGVLNPVSLKMFRELDPAVAPVPWNAEEYGSTRKLRIGYYTFDGFIEATPPCVRAVERTKEILEAQGHHVEAFPIHNLEVSMGATIEAYFGVISSNFVHVMNLMDAQGEVQAGFFSKLILAGRLNLRLPSFITQKLLPWVLHHMVGAKYANLLVPHIGEKLTSEYWTQNHVKNQIKEAITAQMKKQNLDLLICPVNSMPAAPHDSTTDFTATASYCFLQNMIDWPAGVVPATRLDPKKDALGDDYWKNEIYNAGDTLTHGAMRRAYDRVIARNVAVPVGVQVWGMPFEEEKVLRAMNIIETNGDFKDSKFTFPN